MAVLSVGSLAWLGVRSSTYEAERQTLRLESAGRDALGGIASVIAARVLEIERGLDRALAALGPGAADARSLERGQPLIRQVFRLDGAGALVYPDAHAGPLSTRERDFIQQTAELWDRGLPASAVEEPARDGPRGRWHTWKGGAGPRYLYFATSDDGPVLGVEVEGAALLADIIATLPQTPLEGAVSARMVLGGDEGEILYQWGGYEPPEKPRALALQRLDSPFTAWTLAYYAPPADTPQGVLPLGLSIAAVALTLCAGAALLWRESTRDAREAGRRVSFVNHVSHELKTPLTNIRMYAELLEGQLERKGRVAAGELGEKLGVIVDESRRLSRLIHNVLSFARRDRGALAVSRSPGVVDEILRSVLDDFGPRLEQAGIRVDLRCHAGERVWVDADALEQILANLVGNVEKYAAAGGVLWIESTQTRERTTVRLRDRGPGIPPGLRERIFEPFYRLSNDAADGAAGTGIGLTIARDLARLHGGELALDQPPEGGGARFVLTIGTAPVEGP